MTKSPCLINSFSAYSGGELCAATVCSGTDDRTMTSLAVNPWVVVRFMFRGLGDLGFREGEENILEEKSPKLVSCCSFLPQILRLPRKLELYPPPS